MELRCSALPRIMGCPASTAAPEVYINQTSDEARMGTAAHDALRHIIETDPDAFPETTHIARKNGIEDKDLQSYQYMVWSGWNMWIRIKSRLKNIVCEKQIKVKIRKDVWLSGSSDVSADATGDEFVPIIWDHKSYDTGKNHANQVWGYLHLKTVDEGLKWANAKLIVGYLDSGELCIEDVTWADYQEWLAALQKAIDDKFYSPGSACQYCPLENQCEARSTLVRSVATDFGVKDQYFEAALDSMSPQDLGLMKPKVDLLDKAIKKFRATLKSNVRSLGSIPLGDGRVLKIKEEKRQTVDFQTAKELFSEEDFEKIEGKVKLSKTGLLDALLEDIPKGGKAAEKRAVLARLEEAKAFKSTTIEKMVTVKEEKMLEGAEDSV